MAESVALITFLIAVSLFVIVIGDFNVVFLHTNDFHARIEQIDKYGNNCSQADTENNVCYGGVARMKTVIDDIRRNHSNVLLMDAGDLFQGSVWYSFYRGQAIGHFMNRLGYDVITLGNHELEIGVPALISNFLNDVTFPVVSCNIHTSDDPDLGRYVPNVTVVTVGGQEIGVIGVLTKSTENMMHPEHIKDIEILETIPSVQRAVGSLQAQGIDKIVLLAHLGLTESQQIARQVAGIDLIIDGHSGSFLYNGAPPDIEEPVGPYPVVVEREDGSTVLIYSAYTYGKYLGVAHVTFDDSGVVKEYQGNPVLLDGSIRQDPGLLTEVEEWRNPLQEFASTIIGESYVVLEGATNDCRLKESNAGNLITDAVLYENVQRSTNSSWSDVAMSVWNGGEMRRRFKPGPISNADVLELLPFNNEIEKIWLKGSTLREMLEHSASLYDEFDPQGGFLQMSGIQVTYNIAKPSGSRVHSVEVRCADCPTPKYSPLDDGQTYALLTSTFLGEGAHDYCMLRDDYVKKEYIGTRVAEAVISYIAKQSPLVQGEEARISFYTEDEGDSCTGPRGLSYDKEINTHDWLIP